MRLSPAHVVSALKSRRPTSLNLPGSASSQNTAQFLSLSLASMLPGAGQSNLTEIRERRTEREDELRSRYESATADQRAAPCVADQLQSDERNMKAGSRASTRQAGMELARERMQSSRDAFRSALSQARTASQPAMVAGPTSGSVSANEAAPANDEAVLVPSVTPADTKDSSADPLAQAATTERKGGPTAPGNATLPQLTVSASAAAVTATSTQNAAGVAARLVDAASNAVKSVAAAEAPAAPGSAGSSSAQKQDAPPAPGPVDRVVRNPGLRAKADDDAPADSTGTRENIDRILRVLRGQILRGKSTTVIRMDPPELGYLRLQLDLHKDVLRLRIHAETDVARQMLSDDLDALRKGLEAAGLRLEQVEIRPLTPVDGSTAQQAPAWQGSSSESFRHGSRGSRPQTERVTGNTTDRTDAVEANDAAQAFPTRDARVNVVV